MGLYYDTGCALHAAKIDPKNFFAAYDPNPEKSAEYLAEKIAAEAGPISSIVGRFEPATDLIQSDRFWEK